MELPFDPSRMAAARDNPPADQGEARALRVSELAARISLALATEFPASVRVVGEVSGFRERTHWYFDLKDAEAVIACVMFASSARRAGAMPADGREVVVSGRVEFYAKGGKTTLVVTSLRPVGEGALERAYRELCDELRGLGWFAPERKRPVPFFPRRVAIVTSRSGAALQDALDTIRRRCAAVEAAVVDVRVQGPGSGVEIARALDWVSRGHERLGIDAVLLTRGGGSREDLAAFNERVVAQAIVSCRVPVVAAIGHETDTTIAELVADERAATPTQGAMRLTPSSADLSEQVGMSARRLRGLVARARERAGARLADGVRGLGAALALSVSRKRERVSRLAVSVERRSPRAEQARRTARLREAEARLSSAIAAVLERARVDEAGLRLASWADRTLDRARSRVDVLEARVLALGPDRVLSRGFSLTVGRGGRIVRSVTDVRAGERVRTHVSDGSFASKVEGSRPRKPGERAQLDLFAPGE